MATYPFTVPAPTKSAGQSGFIADINEAYNAVQALAGINVLDSQWGGGADPTGATDSTTAIQAALNGASAQGGGVVWMPPGQYMVSGISIPPLVTLWMLGAAVTLNQFSSSAGISRIFANPAWAPGSSTGIVNFLSKTPGGWATNAYNSGLRNAFLDGSSNASVNIQGIAFQGPVYDTLLEDVFVWKPGHNGVGFSGVTESGIAPTFPYHQRWRRVSVVSAANVGFSLANLTDSELEIFAFGCASDGVVLQNNSNSRLRVRSEWSSGGRGVTISGSGGSVIIDLSTDQNAKEGLYVSGATGQATQGGGLIVGGKLHADGNAGGADNIGIKITGSTVPLDIAGLNVESGQNVNNSLWYPATALSIDTSSDVTVAGCTLQGITSAWTDGGGNANVKRTAVIGMTGNPGSQVTVALPDLPAGVNPAPADQGLLAWAYDPVTAGSGTAATSGTLHLIRVNVREPQPVTNLVAYVTSAGSGLTAAQNLAGIYSSAGTLVASTADQTAAWGSTGVKTMALTGGPYTLAPGYYWVALLSVGTTPPSFLRTGLTGTAAAADSGISAAAQFRFAVNGTALTALPSPVTPASNTHTGSQQFWAAMS